VEIMSYNVLDGANRTIPPLVRTVQSKDPDVLAIQEANGWEEEDGRIPRIVSEQTGLPYYYLSLSTQSVYHTAFFSRFPIEYVEAIPGFRNSALLAVVNTEFGPTGFCNAHFSPFGEDHRLPELKGALNALSRYKNKVLMGDLNSLSPEDNYDPRMVEEFSEGQLTKFTRRGSLRFDVLKRTRSAGFRDSAVETGQNHINTVPTPVNTDPYHTSLRLDYILLAGPIAQAVRAYEVVKTPDSDQASDHYPIVITLG
jgi:exodeoxyribonuclease III